MAVANLLEALNNIPVSGYERPTLRNISIYGRIRCLIEKPDFMYNIVSMGGYYALVDAYALKCLDTDYFAKDEYFDYDKMYLTKGSILIFINNPSMVGKDVRIMGASKFKGVNIKQQSNSSKDNTTGISGFVFGRPEQVNGKKVFPLVPSVVYELTKSDIKNTILEDVNLSSNEIGYPNILDDVVVYSGVKDYLEYRIKNSASTSYDKSTDKVDISSIDMKLEYHLNGLAKPDYFDAFKEDVIQKSKDRKEFVNTTLKSIKEGLKDIEDMSISILKNNFIGVASNYNRQLGIPAVSVKTYLMKFIDNLSDLSIYKIENREPISNETIVKVKNGVERLKSLVLTNPEYLYGNTGFEDVDVVFNYHNDSSFVLNVISTITGIDYDCMISNVSYISTHYGYDVETVLSIMIHTPYVLGLFGTGMNVSMCDIIYYSISEKFNSDVPEEIKNLCISLRKLMLMLDTLKTCTINDTFVKISDYKRAKCSYPKIADDYIRNYGFMARKDIITLLSLVLEVPISVSSDVIPSKWFDNDIFETLETIGVVNTLEDTCIGLEYNIEKEMVIYEVFQGKGSEESGLTDDDISKTIEEFESSRGFKLEKLQKDAINLCKYKAGVLSGCAGSGKTTTSDCITEALKKLGKVNIIYSTPTGKACRRLAEVVHSPVKTIHSQFNVSIGGSSYFSNVYYSKKDYSNTSKTVYILDEMAMCNTDLLYHVARNMFKDDMCYFLGDIKQLPPIGGGCPFRYLMKFLPCVELGVSKRASEGSLVNYNVSLLNFMSDDVCKELSYDKETFIAKPCNDVDILRTTENTFKEFLKDYDEDDIQVITGYQAHDKASSASRLNMPLQQLLRRNDKVAYYKEAKSGYEDLPFYINDRVIYVNRNSYDICRYIYKDGVFQQVFSFGCVNGEMGKIVGVVNTSDVRFNLINEEASNVDKEDDIYSNLSEDEYNVLVERFKGKYDSLRNDDSFSLSDYRFVIVKVYDADLSRDVYVLLRGKVTTEFETGVCCLAGSDLNNLNLAYALTCHKMQGSQNKVIISVLESGGSPMFINRNLINTMITRSQGTVAMVGSIIGFNSMLNRGRKFVSHYSNKNLLSMFSGDESWVY